jgi:hypothetical protein
VRSTVMRSLAVVGLGAALVAGSAVASRPASAAPLPGGVGTPGVEGVSSSAVWQHEIFEVGFDHRVVHWHWRERAVVREDFGGYAVGGASATQIENRVEAVAVRGADAAVWLRERHGTGPWTGWRSLGGRTGAHPAITSFTAGDAHVPFLLVLVRGTDGAMWERVKGPSGWTGWRRVGGTLTSSPAASGLRAAVRGPDGQVWTASRAAGLDGRWSPWTRTPALPDGMRAASEPGLEATFGESLYVRGSDAAAWVLSTDGWQSMGGAFTSGIVAIYHSDGVVGGVFSYGRGLNDRLYEKAGTGSWHLLGSG